MTSKLMWFVTTNIDRIYSIRLTEMAFVRCSMGGETDLWEIASHNVHETVGKHQESGTAVLSYGNLLQ